MNAGVERTERIAAAGFRLPTLSTASTASWLASKTRGTLAVHVAYPSFETAAMPFTRMLATPSGSLAVPRTRIVAASVSERAGGNMIWTVGGNPSPRGPASSAASLPASGCSPPPHPSKTKPTTIARAVLMGPACCGIVTRVNARGGDRELRASGALRGAQEEGRRDADRLHASLDVERERLNGRPHEPVVVASDVHEVESALHLVR